MSGNTLFRTLKEVRIASTTGHIIIVKPGEPVAIPPELHEDAYAAGCVPVDSPDHVVPAVPQGEDRERAIIDAINLLIVEGDINSFRKADGVPKVDPVQDKFGYAVTSAEVELAFGKVKEVAAALQESNTEDAG